MIRNRNNWIGNSISVIGISHNFFEFGRRWQLLAVFKHSLNMQAQGLLGKVLGLIDTLTSGDETGKSGNETLKSVFIFFVDNSNIMRRVVTSTKFDSRLAFKAF